MSTTLEESTTPEWDAARKLLECVLKPPSRRIKAAWVDSDENGYVNNGDSITIYSPDTTDLYFTCVELHDTYVYMYTGDTPSMMTIPGFTAIFSLVAIIGAFVAITRRD